MLALHPRMTVAERSATRLCLSLLSTRERWQASMLTVLALLGACAEALGIGAVFPFMSLLANPALIDTQSGMRMLYEFSRAASASEFIVWLTLALLALFVLKNLFLAMLYSLQARFVSRVESRLATVLFTTYLAAPYSARLGRNSSDRTRIITGEVGRVAAGFLMPLVSLVSEALVVLGVVVLLLLINPTVACLALALVAVICVIVMALFRQRLQRFRDIRVRANTGMFKWVHEGLGALKEAKVLGREAYFAGAFQQHSSDYARATQVFTTMNMAPRLLVETTAVAALLLAVLFSMYRSIAPQEVVPLLTLFGLAAVRIMPSATRILAALNNFRYYAPAVQVVAADMALVASLKPVVADAGAPAQCARLSQLALEQVSFTYPGESVPALTRIDLALLRGEAIAVVGRSGSGKTTLGDVLLGLLAPDEGSILLNGAPVQRPRDLQGLCGLVPQDFFLRDDTVRRNVAFGLPDEAIDDERIWSALREARLEDRVRSMPALLDTPVGERGALLSGGERQRLSIARALYSDPEILVLDEATSALDPATESELIGVLSALKSHKTIVMITHRIASTAWCDRVVVMSQGRIVAAGSYAELLATNREFGDMASGLS